MTSSSPEGSVPVSALPDDRAALTFALANFELENLVSLESVLGLPQDNDGDRENESSSGGDSSAADGSGTGYWDPSPLLDDLWERDEQLLAGGCVLPSFHVMEFLTSDDNGRLERHVAARVYEGDRGEFGIPFGEPLHEPFFRALEERPFAERVRLLTEFVRVFSNAVGLGGLSEGIRADAVCRLRDLVGLLRSAVRDASDHPSDDSKDGGSSYPDPRSDDLRVHAESVARPSTPVGGE